MVTLGQTILPHWVGADQQVNTDWMAKVGQGTRVSVFLSKKYIVMLNHIHIACYAQPHTRCMLEYVCGADVQLCRVHHFLRAASNIVLGLQLS